MVSMQEQLEALYGEDTKDTKDVLSAATILSDGAAILTERGKQYDNTSGERSMERTVRIFAEYTGIHLKESDGWLFMQVLKDVRQLQTKDAHIDSLVDCVNYAALKAEARIAGN